MKRRILLPGGAPSFAQQGEDRILLKLFKRLKPTNRVAVEFGAWDGRTDSNTAALRQRGWRVVWFDCAPKGRDVIQATVTAENVNDLFRAHRIPQALDCLSIDIDGNDLWVWEALTFEPRVVVIEYNAKWSADVSATVPYEPMRAWNHSDYYGASVRALWTVGMRKGYSLVNFTRTNLFFVQQPIAPRALVPEQVRLTSYLKVHDPLDRPWVAYP